MSFNAKESGMIKETIEKNSQAKVNSREIKLLKRDFPQCFDKDGKFDFRAFEDLIRTEEVDIKKEGYSLDFLGKSYARYLASLDSETVIVPDEENKSIDSQNIYIVGDNLDALQHLKYSYSGKIKCIYIDPPYNTGSDGFVYNDRFEFTAEELARKINIEEDEAQRVLDMQGKSTHSAWLTFMYPRLELARDLLDDDGVILISVDDNEQANCKLLCDSVFGEGNFVAQIIWKRKRGRDNSAKWFSKSHEYLLAYAKDTNKFIINLLDLDDETKRAYKNPDKDPRGVYRLLGCWARGTQGGVKYSFITKNGQHFSERLWLLGKENLEKLDSEDKLVIHGDNVYRKLFIFENEGKIPETLWDNTSNAANAADEIKKLFSNIVFDTPKPIPYIMEMLKIATRKDDIILDFFSGSATTAHAVMQRNIEEETNCKYIMVQLDEPVKKGSEAEKAGYKTIDEIGRERIRRAAKKLAEDNPEKAKGVDLGFKTYYLKATDKNTLDKIIEFNPMLPIDGEDIKSKFGVDTVLETWKIKDGYGFNTNVQKIDLRGYTAYLLSDSKVGTSLYLIEDMPEKSIIELVRKIEAHELNLDRIIEYGYAFSYSTNTALRSNLKTLKNRTSIEPILRY